MHTHKCIILHVCIPIRAHAHSQRNIGTQNHCTYIVVKIHVFFLKPITYVLVICMYPSAGGVHAPYLWENGLTTCLLSTPWTSSWWWMGMVWTRVQKINLRYWYCYSTYLNSYLCQVVMVDSCKAKPGVAIEIFHLCILNSLCWSVAWVQRVILWIHGYIDAWLYT